MSPWVVALAAAAAAAVAGLLTPSVRAFVPADSRWSGAAERSSRRLFGAAGPASWRWWRGAASASWRWWRSWVHVVLAGAAGLGAGLVADGVAELVAFVAAGVGCALLAVVDLAVHRLPNRLVGGTLLALLGPLLIAAVVGGEWPAFGRAVLGALVLLAGYFVLAFISPSGLGLGDVKFAAVVGAFLGWFGWQHVAVGTLLAFALNAVVALALLVTRRGTLKSDIPFGPAMMLGAVLAVVVLGR